MSTSCLALRRPADRSGLWYTPDVLGIRPLGRLISYTERANAERHGSAEIDIRSYVGRIGGELDFGRGDKNQGARFTALLP